MSKELKNKIDSVDSANQAYSDLETKNRNLREEVQRLNFTIGEQKQIIQIQKTKLSSVQIENIPEDVSMLKDLVTQQRKDIIKKDKDVEILQQTIAEVTAELENVKKFEEESEVLIYANKEIVQLTEENENFRLKVEELYNNLTILQEELDNYKKDPSDENSLKQEIEYLTMENQENASIKNQYSQELIGANKIIDQLTFDNDQYHEKVIHLLQKLEEVEKFQDEPLIAENDENDNENENINENINQILIDLEIENNDLKNLVNTNISIIENLEKRIIDTDKKFEQELNFGNQRFRDLQDKVLDKDAELNNVKLKLQKFENANNKLSDLIVEFKVQQNLNGESIEFEGTSDRHVYEDLPPNLFFRLYRLLSENDKITIENQLINDLSSVTRDNKTYAIKILSVITGDRIFKVLKNLINDNDWIVKLYLIKAFLNFNKADTIPLLKELQGDKDIDVREAATNALSEISDS